MLISGPATAAAGAEVEGSAIKTVQNRWTRLLDRWWDHAGLALQPFGPLRCQKTGPFRKEKATTHRRDTPSLFAPLKIWHPPYIAGETEVRVWAARSKELQLDRSVWPAQAVQSGLRTALLGYLNGFPDGRKFLRKRTAFTPAERA